MLREMLIAAQEMEGIGGGAWNSLTLQLPTRWRLCIVYLFKLFHGFWQINKQ